jgi:hypothetical protein
VYNQKVETFLQENQVVKINKNPTNVYGKQMQYGVQKYET